MLYHSVDDSVCGGDNYLTHLTLAIDCHLNVKSSDAKEDDDCFDECVDGCFDGYVDGHVDCCVGKEDGVDDSVGG
eukprot:10717525-Ditylum_brightwellii.AAC.1